MANDIVEEMYLNKQADYFSLERDIFKNAVKGTGLTIFDVGCGTGVLGNYFKVHQLCKVYGIEINQDAYQIAIGNLDDVIKGNIEMINLPYQNDFFDVIIMGDVLEHLVNPVGAIKKLIRVLKPGGKLLITVPNVRHWKVLINLVCKDQWKYGSWGILDYTHLRFFTKTSIVELLKQNSIQVQKAEWVIQKPSKSHFIDRLTFRIFSGFLASHTFLAIEKPSSAHASD